jgi:probable HAF family extracellular repeat protein
MSAMHITRHQLNFFHVVALPVAVLAWANGDSTHAQSAFFMGLGDLPGGTASSQPWDISADGSVVVGVSNSVGGNEAFRWTRDTGMVALGIPGGGIFRISADGSTIIRANDSSPVRWTNDAGILPLPFAIARGLSGDGSVIVGQSTSGSPNQAIRWTEPGGVKPLFVGSGSTVAWDMSDDGTVILANELNLGPFVWSAASGSVYLGGPHLTISTSYGGISDNGEVVFGFNNQSGASRPFRWTEETGAVEIGTLPDGVNTVSARGVSKDGSIVVGNSASAPDVPQKAYIWDEIHGPRYLLDVLLNEAGLRNDLAGWTLGVTRGISADGRTLTGYGTNHAGNTEAWIAYLGPAVALPGDFNDDGTVDAADYVVWRKNNGTQSGHDTWRANFGRTAASESRAVDLPNDPRPAVPEPNMLALIVLALAPLPLQLRTVRSRIRACPF